MFKTNTVDKVIGRVEIKDIEPEIFQLFLEFIYIDNIIGDKTSEEPIKLLNVADTHQINSLKIICGKHQFKNLKNDNAIDIFITVLIYELN